MERISANHNQTSPAILPFAPPPAVTVACEATTSSQNQKSPPENPTTGQLSGIADAVQQIREDLKDLDIELISDSDVSATSSHVPIEDLSDDCGPISPPRRPNTLKLKPLKYPQETRCSPTKERKSPQRAVTPQKTDRSRRLLPAADVDPQQLSRVRRMRFVQTPQ